MKFDNRYDLEKAAAGNNSTRTCLQYVNVVREDGEKGRAIATDGHILAVVPVTLEDGDVPGLVAARYFTLARRQAKRWEAVEIALHAAHVIFKDGVIYPRASAEMTGVFPDVENVIPPHSDKGTHVVALNPKRLARLGAAFGVGDLDSLVLQNGSFGLPVRVTVQRCDGLRGSEVGVIQPDHLTAYR